MTPRTLAASAVLALTAAGGAYVETRPTRFLITSVDGGTEWVIPDCRSRLQPTGWDERHAPVDCLASGPYARGGPPVWRGCSVFRAEYALGSECLPARFSVAAGEDPLAPVP
jgi:hypothetical protein